MSLFTHIRERYGDENLIILQEDQIISISNMDKYYSLSSQTLNEIRNNLTTSFALRHITDKFAIWKWNYHRITVLLPDEIANNPITHIFPMSTLLNSIDSRVLLDKAWDTPRISGKLLEFVWKDVEIRYIGRP